MLRFCLLMIALVGTLLPADLPPAYGKVPLSFAPSGAPGAYSAHGGGYSFDLTAQRATLHLSGATVSMQFVGARPGARLEATGPLPGVMNWFVGSDRSQWRYGVPTYARLRAARVLPGVDLVYYGNQQQLEYDLLVAPGADPAALRWAFSGVTGLRLGADGALLLATAAGELRWRAPEVYQQKGGARIPVPSAYTLHPGHRIGFRIGAYDKTVPLVIDPTFDYVRYLTGPGRATAIQVDQFGQAFIAGSTPQGRQSGENAFVAKLDSNGGAILFLTIFGGSGDDRAFGLVLENRRGPYVYLTGSTETPAGFDAFLYRFDAYTGSNLYQPAITLGGSGADAGHAIGLHPTDGSVYIAGVTDSPNLRIVNGVQPVKGAGQDGFLMRVHPDGAVLYSTYLGGGGADSVAALQVDAGGRVWLAGTSTSPDAFAAPATHQPRNAGGADCLVTGLSYDGSSRVFSSYLGGAADDGCTGLGLTPGGNIVVSGYTDSPNFPTVNPTQAAHGGARDMFVAEFGPVAGLQFSTFLGGPRLDTAHGVAVDESGTIHLAGESTGQLPLLNPVAAEKAGSPGVLLRAATPGGALNQSIDGFGAETEITAWAFASATEAFAAGNSGRLYRSLDGGASWVSVATAPAGGIQTLAISGSALLAATPRGVWLSLDRGATWRSVNNGLPAELGRSSVLVNPETGAFSLAHPTAGFFRSLTNGVSWTSANTGLTNRNSLHLAADPQNPSLLYLATAGGVFRSGDAGGSWSLAGGTRVLTQVAPTPEAGTLYGVEEGRPVLSTDAARTWTPLPLPIGDAVVRLAVDPLNARHVLAATAATGLWRTLDSGATWALASAADATALDAHFAPGGGAVLASLRNLPDAVIARWGRLPSGANRYNYYQASVSYFGTHQADAGLAVTHDANTINTYLAGYSAGSPFVTRFGPSPGACGYKATAVSTAALSNPGGGSGILQMAAPSGCAWTATAGAPWLQLHGSGSRTGSGELRAFTLRNDSPANRETTLTAGGATFTVRQNGTACETEARIVVTNTTIPAQGMPILLRLEIPAGCEWTTAGPNWMTIHPAQGTGSADFMISAFPYGALEPRSATVRIGPRVLEVQQAGACGVALQSRDTLFPPLGGASVLTLETGPQCPWSLVPANPSLTFTSAATGTGPASVGFILSPNPGPARTIRIGPVSLHQDGSECTYTPGATLLQSTKEPVTLRLPVTTQPTCRRPAVSDQPWLQVSGNLEFGNGELQLILSRNSSATHRTARVTLGSQTVTVVQGAQAEEAPSVSAPAPLSGFGLSNTFSLDITDRNGDLDVVNLLINSSLDARGACYLAYVRSTNTLYLVPDSGEGLIATNRRNSQCSVPDYLLALNGHDTGASLSLPITFSPSFAGNKILYAAARDKAGHNTGWLPLGVWNVPSSGVTASSAPQVTSLVQIAANPGQMTLEMTVSDPDGIANLNVLNLLINDGLDARNACYLAYVHPTRTLYLVPDAGEGLLPAGVNENRQCRVLPPGVNAIPEPGRLKIRVPLELKSGPVRHRIIYGAAGDLQGNNSGWQALGAVTVP